MSDIPISFGRNVTPDMKKAASPYIKEKNGQQVVNSNVLDQLMSTLSKFPNAIAKFIKPQQTNNYFYIENYNQNTGGNIQQVNIDREE